MDQETEYLAALQAGEGFTIRDDRLEIRDASGALQVSAIPAETTSE
jgi:hypothetical protein